jgi:hypothetical protein
MEIGHLEQSLFTALWSRFRDTFINEATGELKNKNVLAKRLTGLISYYKGSKAG